MGTCWQSGSPPSNGDDVVINSSGSDPNNYDITRTLNSITFSNDGHADTIANSGGTLTLQSGGFITDNNTNVDVINTGMSLSGPATFTLSSGASGLSFGGSAVTGTGPLTLTNNASTTLTLGVANSYTGATTVSGTGSGQTVASVNGAIPTGSALTVSGKLTFSASSTIGSLAGAGNVALGSTTLTAGGDNTNTTFSGVLSGTGGGLTKNGSGTLTLSGANTYTGGTTISAGTLAGTTTSLQGAIVNNAAVTFDQSTSGTYAGVMSGTGALTKAGTGTVTLSGANTYTGATTINAGTLNVSADSNLGGAAGGLTFGGGTLQYGAGFTSARGVTLNAGGGTLDTNGNNATLSGTISGSGALTKAGTGTLTLSGANTYSGGTTVSAGVLQGTTTGLQGNITDNANVTFNQAGNGTYAGALSGTGGLTVTGGGTVTLPGTSTYTGATTINAGMLAVTGSLTSPVTVNSGGTLGGTGTISAAVTVNSGGTLRPGTSPGIINTGTVTLTAGSTLVIELNGPTVGSQYDQVNVTGTVTLGGATLSVVLGFTPTAGQVFTIINNDGVDPVTGTFAGLAEGSTFTAGGHQFSISYVGGTGNDVTLTAAVLAPDLAMTKTHVGTFTQGQSGAGYTLTVSNVGGAVTSGTVTVTDTLPAGLSATAISGPGWTCSAPPTLTCTRADALAAGGSYPVITLTVHVAADAPASVINTATVSGGGDTNTANNTATDPTTIALRARRIVTGAGPGGGPHVRVFDAVTGADVLGGFAYAPTFTGGVYVAVGDVNGDGVPDIITGPGAGSPPLVRAFDGRTGVELRRFLAYEPEFTGGVRVAVAVTGDGVPAIITGPGPGRPPEVRVFDGRTGGLLGSFFAYDPAFTGGVFVAAGDVNGDGFADIITGADTGGGPEVKVFSGRDGHLLDSFFAYDPAFTGGVRVAVGDLDGDGFADIITGAGPGGGPHVEVFSGRDGSLLGSFFAYDPAFRGGVYVGAGPLGGDSRADIITGPGAGSPPLVRVFDGRTGVELASGLVYDPAFTGGVRVGGSEP